LREASVARIESALAPSSTLVTVYCTGRSAPALASNSVRIVRLDRLAGASGIGVNPAVDSLTSNATP